MVNRIGAVATALLDFVQFTLEIVGLIPGVGDVTATYSASPTRKPSRDAPQRHAARSVHAVFPGLPSGPPHGR